MLLIASGTPEEFSRPETDYERWLRHKMSITRREIGRYTAQTYKALISPQARKYYIYIYIFR
jgi:hypothetical protein